MKKCRRCKKDKPANDFMKRPENRDGRETICIDCARKEKRVKYVPAKDRWGFIF